MFFLSFLFVCQDIVPIFDYCDDCYDGDYMMMMRVILVTSYSISTSTNGLSIEKSQGVSFVQSLNLSKLDLINITIAQITITIDH